ncbi:hypothetical protein KUCAC02_010885, partial [Chaenocephalus aceratus]
VSARLQGLRLPVSHTDQLEKISKLPPDKLTTEKRESQDTVTPSDIINKQKAHKETKQPAKQPATILNRLLKETHTERKEANAYFDQQTFVGGEEKVGVRGPQSEVCVWVEGEEVVKETVDSDNRD